MRNIVRAAMVLGLLASASSFSSDLYRCDSTDGRTSYQGSQCAIGVRQKAIDPQNARREQIQKALEEERKQKQQQKEAAAATTS